MKIAHIHYWDTLGGAAKGMYTLHTELKKLDIDSSLVVAKKISTDKDVIELYNSSQREDRKNIDHIPERFYKKKQPFMINNNLLDSPELLQTINKLNPDIIHIHWLGHGLCSLEDLVKFNKPIVWTLRDWAAMTGGCHHPFSCDRFHQECGKCPILNSNINYDLCGIKYCQIYIISLL